MQVHSGDVAAEAETLLKLGRHPRLVQFLGMCREGDTTWLVMEFAPMGSLDQQLEEMESTITPAHKLAILQQVCAGCEAMTSENMIHRQIILRPAQPISPSSDSLTPS